MNREQLLSIVSNELATPAQRDRAQKLLHAMDNKPKPQLAASAKSAHPLLLWARMVYTADNFAPGMILKTDEDKKVDAVYQKALARVRAEHPNRTKAENESAATALLQQYLHEQGPLPEDVRPLVRPIIEVLDNYDGWRKVENI
jgi:RNase H-fold protein (predicted Holliday junction resolvase)